MAKQQVKIDLFKKNTVYTFLTLFVVLNGLIFMFYLNSQKTNHPDFHKTVVWKAGENNSAAFRIPGIVVTPDGTILAFAEERPVFGDADPKSIVLKRSKDGGINWSDNINIEKSDGSYWAEHLSEIDANDVANKKEVWTNVAPIVDKRTGRIFFFYALNEGKIAGKDLQRHTRVFYKYSDDDGISWSERKEITNILNTKEDGSPNKDTNGNWTTDINGFPCDFLGRAFHMPGPGHGIQLSNGRLLLQFWNRTALGKLDETKIPINKRQYGVCTIYSDDHGKSWKYGSAFGHNGANMNESRIVELEKNKLYLNARYINNDPEIKNNYRKTAISYDNGNSWSEIKTDKNFPLSSPCDAGLISLKIKNRKRNILLYSKNESLNGRKNLVIRLSYDEGESWSNVKVVDSGSAGYSDMAVLSDGTILLIYETGKNSPVYCARLNQKWIGI